MKIYFSCSITGGRTDQPIYREMVRWMQAHGHHVLTAHLADPDIMKAELVADAVTVCQRDIAWIDEADVVVAEVSTPSHGVGYEIAYAVMTATPVLCLARDGGRVSKMITGNDRLKFFAYRDEEEATKIIDEFLRI
mgnify:CR=1 FL=1